MPTSLVTGGAGFIGAHVADQLLKAGHRLVVLDDMSGGFRENVPPGAELVVGSILDHRLVDGLFDRHRFDYVFHLAAYAAEGLSHFIKRFNYNNNLIGTVNLINASVNFGVRHFVFTSSIAVYGAGQTPLTEEMIPVPEDPYGVAKLACEQELRVTQHMFGLDYTIFRPHNVYGEKQNIADRYRNVVGIFINQALKGEPMTVFGDGEQQRAFTHVNDVAPLIAEAVNTPGARNELFNVGADVPFTVNELARVASAAMGVPCRVTHLEPRNEVKFAFSDHSKAERVFGKRKKTSLEEGIGRMAEWARRHGARESGVFENIEIPKGLPPSWARAVSTATARGNGQKPVRFRCNICGANSECPEDKIGRELPSCSSCGSTVRWRSIVDVLSIELFGASLALQDFPSRPDLRGIGMTDWEGYARPLAQKLGYTNTYYHTEPKFDITAPPAGMKHALDFVISSEVFEHIPPPVSVAFDNLRHVLKPGGVVVFTVPWGLNGKTKEHFPDLYDWRVEQRDGSHVLINRTRAGTTETFPDLVFHGGPGTTLEMRQFSKASLLEEFTRAGFTDIKIHDEERPEFGIYWNEPWSLPVSARGA